MTGKGPVNNLTDHSEFPSGCCMYKVLHDTHALACRCTTDIHPDKQTRQMLCVNCKSVQSSDSHAPGPPTLNESAAELCFVVQSPTPAPTMALPSQPSSCPRVKSACGSASHLVQTCVGEAWLLSSHAGLCLDFGKVMRICSLHLSCHVCSLSSVKNTDNTDQDL